MGIPLPVAIAISLNRQNKREAAARRREKRLREENSKKSEKRDSLDFGYIDYVGYAVRNNPKLRDFFKKIEDKVQDIRTKEGAEIRAKAEEFVKLADKYAEEAKKIEEELSKDGVTLGSSATIFCDLREFDARHVEYVLNEPKNDSQCRKYHRCYSFNGAVLMKRDVEESMEKSLEKEIEEIEELEKSISKDVIERDKISKKLQRLERVRAIYLFQPMKFEVKQYLLRKRIDELEKTIRKNDETKHVYEILSNLTPEQKQKIIKYMEAYKCIEKIKNELDLLSCEYSATISSLYKEENISMAMQMLRDDGLSEEEFLTVKQEFTDIKTGKKKYDCRYGVSGREKNFVESLIKVIDNDEAQEERNQGEKQGMER